MIHPSTLLLFALGAAALIALPGPDFFYVATRGLAQGRRAGVLSALGISLGLLFHTVLAALGLTVLLQTSTVAFLVVKWLGAAYLVYLGVRMLRDREVFELKGDGAQLDGRAVVRQGVLTNVFNPKAALTFVAFLPQFVRPGADAAGQIALLGGLLAGMAGAWFSVVGFVAGGVGAWLFGKPQFAHALRWFGGSVMIGLGVRLALARR